MRSCIIAIVMCAATGSAQPWIDHNGKVAWRLPAQFHAPDKTVMINPTLDQLRPYGWSTTVSVPVVEVITNKIDGETRLTIATYAALMETIFGPGAHLSTNITEDLVVATFEQAATNIPLSVLTGFKVARDHLRMIYPGHFSALPYGKSEVITTNFITEWRRAP